MKYKRHQDLHFIEKVEVENIENMPVIIFLHGAGSRGDDLEKLAENPFFRLADSSQFLVFAPLCTKDTWFDHLEELKQLVSSIIHEKRVDPTRIYLMGASMGGYAVWQLAMSMPEVFAAIVPICGGGMYWNAGRLKDVPVWAFHGRDDDVVFCRESIQMVEAVQKNGGNAKLTIYEKTAHDAWSKTYGNPEVFRWLLSNKRKIKNQETVNLFQDQDLYGCSLVKLNATCK